jgi:hypothetical protein
MLLVVSCGIEDSEIGFINHHDRDGEIRDPKYEMRSKFEFPKYQ